MGDRHPLLVETPPARIARSTADDDGGDGEADRHSGASQQRLLPPPPPPPPQPPTSSTGSVGSRLWGFVKRNWVLLATILGAVLGFIIGTLVGQANPSDTAIKLIKLPGNLFVRTLKMLVLPLIVCSVTVGIASLSKAGGGARLGGRTILFYAFTTVVAVVTGLVLVLVIHPGSAADLNIPHDYSRNVTSDAVDVTIGILYAMVPENLVAAAANMDVLGLIVFAIVFAVVATRSGRKGQLLLDLMAAVNKVIMRIVHYVMYVTPLGVLSLLAGRLAESGSSFWSVVAVLGMYILTVLVGLLLHALVTLPLAYAILLRRNPYRYLAAVAQALLTAFGTASSSATLPVSLRQVQEAGVSAAAARFVLPLGSTVNMDGTALYEAVAAIFIAQAYSIALGGAAPVAIAISAILASVGAAGIPEAGLVTMVLVLKSADLPVEGIGLLLPVDWLLDRCRTVVNVWGDIVGAAVIDKYVPAAQKLVGADGLGVAAAAVSDSGAAVVGGDMGLGASGSGVADDAARVERKDLDV